jgi:hypothetical protein
MGSALAIEKVSWFTVAFVLARSWLSAAAEVGANLIAAGDLFLGNTNSFWLSLRHS